MTPYLTDEQIAFITRPLTQPAARTNFLRQAGFHVIVRPDGTPMVSRSNYERVTGGAPASNVVPISTPDAPNEARFLEGRNGKKAQR